MKKLLLTLLVLLGLQTQAQIVVSTCNSYTWNGNTFTTSGQYIFNSDTLNLTIHLGDWSTLSLTSVGSYDWNGQVITNSGTYTQTFTNSFGCDSIVNLNLTITPYFCCDSITYWIDQSQGFNIGLDTTNIIHNPDSIEVLWSICNSSQCYTGTGMYAYFPQIMTTDTIKVCYDAYVYEVNSVEVCTHCDSLVFNGFNWVLFSMSNPTSINELTFNRVNDGKIYDLLGRELTEIPVGKLYIRNQKLYIIK